MGNIKIAGYFSLQNIEKKLTPKCDMNSFNKFVALLAKTWPSMNPYSLNFDNYTNEDSVRKLIAILKQCPSGLSFMIRKGFLQKSTEVFAVGQTVQIFDSSWSMTISPSGISHITKWANCQPCKIISIGVFPTFKKDGKPNVDNDLAIIDTDGTIRFTSSKYALLA